MRYVLKIFLFLLTFLFYPQKDSVHIRLPKHYFPTILLLDYYQKPEDQIVLKPYASGERVGKKLKSYQVQQGIFAFSVPFFTRDKLRKDSAMASHHLLFTGYFMTFNPNFSGLETDHRLVKNGLGIRYIYNNGKKSIFFVDVSPFVTYDKSNPSETRVARNASLFVWNYMVSPKFSLRVGIAKTFLWGNRYYLPYLGFRVGFPDKIHFSFQFPRAIALNIPLKSKVRFSLFTRPMGGFFTLSNQDTLYAANLDNNKYVMLGRYEFLSGIRLDINPVSWFSFYISAGRSARNYLALYSLQYNKGEPFDYKSFFDYKLQGSSFINAGLTFFFGKTRSYYQRSNMYEMMDLHKTTGPGDNNAEVFQGNPAALPVRKLQDNTREISDLINSFDY